MIRFMRSIFATAFLTLAMAYAAEAVDKQSLVYFWGTAICNLVAVVCFLSLIFEQRKDK
jgi:hypothetical protein